VLTASRATTSDGLVARVALDTPLGTQPASIGPGAAHRRRTVRRSAAGKPSPMTVVSRSIRQVPDAPARKVRRRGGGIHASMARKGLGQSKSGPFVRLEPLACPLCADFVAEVAEEESGPWRRATSLACHSPVRAVAGDYSNDCQRAFGATLRSRHACGREWRRPCHELGQPPEVLSDRCQRELELSPARPAQSQAAEPQDTLEMCKQHLNALSVMARSLECFSLG